jgi:predicted dehydrogenase
MFGEAEALWAFTGRLGDLDLDVEDTAEIGIRYQSGMLGSVHLDYNQRPSAHTLEVVGTQGVLRWDNADTPAGFERNDLFLAEMRHFLDVARGKAQPLCTLEDGVQALRLALAARQSAEVGEMVVLGS